MARHCLKVPRENSQKRSKMAVEQEEHFHLNRFCCGWPDLGRQLGGGGSSEQLSALSTNLFHHLIVLQQQVVTDRFLASEQSKTF